MRVGILRTRARRRRFLLGLTLGFLASGAVGAATSLGYFSGYQGKALALYLWAQGRGPAPEIVIVGIDDAAFQRLKERQPLPRDYLAGVIRGLRKSGARLVGLDVDLRQPTVPAEDQALLAAIQGAPGDPAGPVVVARTLRAVKAGDNAVRYRPVPLYDPTLEHSSGFAEVPQDDDGFFRRVPLVVPLEAGEFFPSLSLALLAALGRQEVPALARALAGPEPIALSLPEWDEARGRLLGNSPLRFFREQDWKINFIGPTGSFLRLGSDAIYQLGISEGEVARDNPLRDRIVLVGATFREGRDVFPTPQGIMPGVEIHAHILHSLLTRRQIQPIAWGVSLPLQFGICLLVSSLFAWVRPTRALIVALGAAALAGAGLGTGLTGGGSYWVDLLTPILAIYASSLLHDALERGRIRRSFHQYLGREVAEQIYADDPSLAGQRRTISILFTDLRDFTSLSEGLAAEDVAQQLNEYFPRMVEAVEHHRGIVNDFIGDAVLAIYGAPLANPAHALDAVRTGLRMQEQLAVLNAGWQARGWPTLKMGIGIHTGAVFAGNVGSPRRKKYTVIGDAVNVAARVEGLNKELGTTLLITQDTYAVVRDRVRAKDCGALTVKGRQQAVGIYEVLALAEEAAEPQRRRPWVRAGRWSWELWRSWSRRGESRPRPETPSPS